MFCSMLGEQLLDGKPQVRGSEPLSRRERQTLGFYWPAMLKNRSHPA